MATARDFTFAAYLFASQNAVNAVAVTGATRVRDRYGNYMIAQPGDYVVQDEDGHLRVMKKTLFEAEYTAQGAVTAPNTLLVSNQALTALDLAWTVGDANALPYIEQDGAVIAINEANDGTYSVTGLVANTGYTFRVRNRLNERYSAYLTPVVGYTLPATIVAAPTAGATTTTSVVINWVNADATAKTQVHVDDGAGGAFSQFGADIAAGTATATVTGLTTGTTYKFKVRHEGAVSTLAGAFSPELTQATD